MEIMSSTPAVGIRALRELRKSSDDKKHEPRKNIRVQKKVEETYDYFTREVDPLVGDCITHLLCTQPDNVTDAMKDFFQNRIDSSKSGNSTHRHNLRTKAKTSQRLYLATQISPVLTKLVNRLAVSKPSNVLEFMCEQLDVIKIEDGSPSSSSNTYGNQNEDSNKEAIKPRPATAVHRPDVRNTIKGPSINSIRPDSAPISENRSPTRRGPTRPLDSDASHPNESVTGRVSVPQTEEIFYNIQFAVLGNVSSGKTSFLNCIQGNPHAKVKPTVGFCPITMSLDEYVKIKFYDLGGGKKIRDIWDQYYHDVHGIIFVIDASSSTEEMEESKRIFEQILLHKYIPNKPICIISNKQDKDNILKKEQISKLFGLERFKYSNIFECSCIAASEETATDPRLDEAVEWLILTTKSIYTDLNRRVLSDIFEKTEEEKLKRIQKERKVLKGKIACAYFDQIDKSLLPDNVFGHDDIFEKEEGIKFLAGEIGTELTESIDKEALHVAALVGYQRLALQMIGAMNSPISKVKKPMSWSEIRFLVESILEELGLSVPEFVE